MSESEVQIERMLLAFTVHARESYSVIARQFNKAKIETPVGGRWTEAHVAAEIGRLLQEGKLDTAVKR